MGDLNDPLSRYHFGRTHWSGVIQAGQPQGDDAAAARSDLLVHYHDAVYRYLIARLGNTDAAGEVFSRFAERVVEIHPFLQRANPEKGRFRDYLKAVLSRMVIDYHREKQRDQKKRRPLPANPDLEPSALPESSADDDFQKVWVEELMNHAWRALEQIQKSKGKPYYSMLLHKAQNPGLSSAAMAQHFSAKLDKPISADNLRQLLHRGQELLSDLLIDEVARSLRSQPDEVVDAGRIEEEIIQFGLFDKHRRDALERYRQRK